MNELTHQRAIEKGKRICAILEKKLDDLGVFHVLLSYYGTETDPGVRLSIVRLTEMNKNEGQILTVTYKGRRFAKRSPSNLASGPYGRVIQLLKETNDE